jgi:hypothetical protein
LTNVALHDEKSPRPRPGKRADQREEASLAGAGDGSLLEPDATLLDAGRPLRRWRLGLSLLACAVGLGLGVWRAPSLREAVFGATGARFAAEPAPPIAALSPTLGVDAATAPPLPALPLAAARAALELAGAGDNGPIGWDPHTGLWGHHSKPAWWQSALDLRALVRYLERSGDSDARYQKLIQTVYAKNISLPDTNMPHDFENQFMDDTGWWGLAWLEASRYEANQRHDIPQALRYLRLAERDAAYVYTRPRPCHSQGIEWQVNYPPDTITNAEFVALAAQLSALRADPQGPFYDPANAAVQLSEARSILAWLQSSGLVDMARGAVTDSYDGHCRLTGGPITYTEGEMAEALTQMGRATGDSSYYALATGFFNYVLSPRSGMLGDGLLQEPCESHTGLCATAHRAYDATVYKGLFVDAVADWRAATGAATYDGFLATQARAVLANSSSDGHALTPCTSPHTCQLGFYWSRRVPPSRAPMPPSNGTQESALSALTDALPVARRTPARATSHG